MGRNLCRGCDQVFASLGAFDMHRTGSYGEPVYTVSSTGKSQQVRGYTKPTRSCLSVEAMQAAGMTQNARGWWLANTFAGFGKAASEESPAALDAEVGVR